MLRCVFAMMLSLAACGGGGGGGGQVVPVAPTRLLASDLDLGPSVAQGDLVVRLTAAPDPAPVLLQVAIELPPQLTLPANDRLVAVAPLSDLDGDFTGGRFVVLCGDAKNQNAPPLAVGDLFRLRLQPSLPRQPGTYTVRLRQVRAASRAGEELATETEPVTATVIVR
jgi:hypothetical protein